MTMNRLRLLVLLVLTVAFAAAVAGLAQASRSADTYVIGDKVEVDSLWLSQPQDKQSWIAATVVGVVPGSHWLVRTPSGGEFVIPMNKPWQIHKGTTPKEVGAYKIGDRVSVNVLFSSTANDPAKWENATVFAIVPGSHWGVRTDPAPNS